MKFEGKYKKVKFFEKKKVIKVLGKLAKLIEKGEGNVEEHIAK